MWVPVIVCIVKADEDARARGAGVHTPAASFMLFL